MSGFTGDSMAGQATAEFLPEINAARCIGCELCVKTCPHEVLAFMNNIPQIVNPEACEYTGSCQEVCPTEAITLTYEIVFSTE